MEAFQVDLDNEFLCFATFCEISESITLRSSRAKKLSIASFWSDFINTIFLILIQSCDHKSIMPGMVAVPLFVSNEIIGMQKCLIENEGYTFF